MTDLESLRDQLRTFASDRDWDQFHSPKNLAAALAVEASELLEHFQWLTELEALQDIVSQLLARSGQQLNEAVQDGSLQEICNDNKT